MTTMNYLTRKEELILLAVHKLGGEAGSLFRSAVLAGRIRLPHQPECPIGAIHYCWCLSPWYCSSHCCLPGR